MVVLLPGNWYEFDIYIPAVRFGKSSRNIQVHLWMDGTLGRFWSDSQHHRKYYAGMVAIILYVQEKYIPESLKAEKPVRLSRLLCFIYQFTPTF